MNILDKKTETEFSTFQKHAAKHTAPKYKKFSDNYWASYKIIPLGPKKLLKAKNFEKEGQPSRWRKNFGALFLKLSSATNLTGQFIRVLKVFWRLLWSYKIIYVTPKKLLKAQVFEKKGKSSNRKKQGQSFLL